MHYRAAALLSASPQLAKSFRAAKRFRGVQEQTSRLNETEPLLRGWTLLSWAGTLVRSLIELE